MALHLDPKSTVENVVGGVTYQIRILTQREMARFATHSSAVATRIARAQPGEVAVLDEDDIRRLERCLCLGVAGWSSPDRPKWKSDAEGPRHMSVELLDSIPFGDWMDLYVAIVEANRITEQDSKNSLSPQQ